MRRRRLYPQAGKTDMALRAVRRARKLTRTLINAAAVALCVEAVLFLFTSPHLQVDKVVVQGGSPAVNAWATAQLKTAIGTNFLRAPVQSLEATVAAHPFIKDVAVARRLPTTLAMRVVERKPYACVRSKGTVYIVDQDLVPFRTASAPLKGCAVLDVSGASPPQLGKKWTSAYVKQVVRGLEVARDRGLKALRVSIDRDGYMCLNTVDGVQIRAGSPQDIEKKLYEASRFLMSQAVPLDQIQYVDVSCPTAPALGPRTAKSATP
ncbi:MAG: FtsQ-type POTRA domain-containing protein [Armatimonadetes bacterium]|nr:FtsQ-type POTRA domain-containing protein [Armatimonadota bacterium]